MGDAAPVKAWRGGKVISLLMIESRAETLVSRIRKQAKVYLSGGSRTPSVLRLLEDALDELRSGFFAGAEFGLGDLAGQGFT